MHRMNEAEIYRVVDERRNELGLTQVEVSRRAFNRSDTALIQNLRRGKPPNSRTLNALCDALGLEFYIGPPRGETGDQVSEQPATYDTTPNVVIPFDVTEQQKDSPSKNFLIFWGLAEVI